MNEIFCCSPDVDDNNSNKEVIQKTNTVVCKFMKKKTRTDAVVCNSRYNGWNCLSIFLYLTGGIVSAFASGIAEANFEGCLTVVN
jgi:hypothetical protein